MQAQAIESLNRPLPKSAIHNPPPENLRKLHPGELREILGRFQAELERGVVAEESGQDPWPYFEKACEISPEAFFAISAENFKCGALTLAFKQSVLVLKHAKRNLTRAHAFNNIGTIQSRWQQMDAAKECFDSARELDKQNAAIAHNLSTVCKWRGEFEQAEKWLEKAGRIDPRCYEIAFGFADLWLLAGDYKRGFSQYEVRWRKPGGPKKDGIAKEWLGQDLKGKSIYIYGEQGAGDQIMMFRYLPVLHAQGATIWLNIAKPLRDLLEPWWGTVCHDTDTIEPGKNILVDYECPIMSLPLRCGTTVDNIPAVPCLPFEHKPENKIGICWAGNMSQAQDRARSLPLAAFAPLFDLPYEFESFQIGPASLELVDFPQLKDLSSEIKTFGDTAKRLASVKFLVTCDTSILHLAGSLGVPTLALISPYADWRYGHNKTRTPWYPNIELFRGEPGPKWDKAMMRVRERLANA